MSDPRTVDVTLETVEPGAVMDALLAIEHFAERVYGSRSSDPEMQKRYNALGKIVLPMREVLRRGVHEANGSA